MTRLWTISILLILTSCSRDNGQLESKKQNGDTFIPVTYSKSEPLQDNNDSTSVLQIRIGCGIGGQSSEEFLESKAPLLNENYEYFVNNLNDKNELKRIISVIALEELHKRNKRRLSENEMNLISIIKKSNRSFSLCTGCTGHDLGIVSDIFEGKMLIDVPDFIRTKIGFTKT
jgi:hypothetical protein